jgi:hypothetical protein
MKRLLSVQRKTGELAKASRKLLNEMLLGIHSGGKLITTVGGLSAVVTIQ